MESGQNPLGTLSILAVELREAIWSYALTDTTIVYHAITETVPIPLLGCSKAIREEAISTILRERSVTFQTHAALSGLLTNHKSQQTTDTVKDAIAPQSPARLPKKIRLKLFSENQKLFKCTESNWLEYTEEEPKLARELDGWREALLQYPITHLTTIVMDCNSSPTYHGGPGYALPCMSTFVKRVATRIRMVSKGRCQILLVAPPGTVKQLIWHAGSASFLRSWTPTDDGWSARKIQEAIDKSVVANPSSPTQRSRKRRRTTATIE